MAAFERPVEFDVDESNCCWLASAASFAVAAEIAGDYCRA